LQNASEVVANIHQAGPQRGGTAREIIVLPLAWFKQMIK
jgi:hypothetical protein